MPRLNATRGLSRRWFIWDFSAFNLDTCQPFDLHFHVFLVIQNTITIQLFASILLDMLVYVFCPFRIMATSMSKEALKDLQLTDIIDLDHEIGRGAYGFVKEVSIHGTLCAAKVVHEVLLTHAAKEEYEHVQKMFYRECIQSSKLRHPNLVQFLGVYYPNEDVSLPWLVMEKLHCSLTSLLHKYTQNDLSLSRKISILQDVSLGIQYLHSKNIVHRDISSNNILLTKHLVAKLSDFGVAKMIDPQHAKTHTQTPGTLIFMPPESTSLKPQYHTPVDVFSFGCVTIHIMTHKWPVPEDPVAGTEDLRALSEIERRKKYLSEVKIIQPIKMLIAGCLKNEPKQRPTISEVVQKLQAIVTEQSLFVYSNVIELEKHFKSEQGVETVSANKDVSIAHTDIRNTVEPLNELLMSTPLYFFGIGNSHQF